MRRGVLALSVWLGLVFGLFTPQASAEEPAWAAAYEEVLAGYRVLAAEDPAEYGMPELSYLLYDVDKDGAPELLIKTGTCEADYHGWLYTFRGGSAQRVGGELGLGHSSFYSDPGENGIIQMYGHMGYACAMRLSLTDELTEETLYEDDLNERLRQDEDADYVYPGDVIPGSVYLTLCRGGLTLPLKRYEEICRCLDGDLPAAAEAVFPNGDEGFFDRLVVTNGEVYAVTADGFTNSPGWIAVRDLLRRDAAANWMAGDLRVLNVETADLNGDGQLEAVLTASDGGSEMRIILSEQEGAVYAYLMNYTDGYELDPEGCICPTRYVTSRFRLIFDREEAFLLALPY